MEEEVVFRTACALLQAWGLQTSSASLSALYTPTLKPTPQGPGTF